jgi:hypothetical protein
MAFSLRSPRTRVISADRLLRAPPVKVAALSHEKNSGDGRLNAAAP